MIRVRKFILRKTKKTAERKKLTINVGILSFLCQGPESDLRRPSICTPVDRTSHQSCPASTASRAGPSPSSCLRKVWSANRFERFWWRTRTSTQQHWLWVFLCFNNYNSPPIKSYIGFFICYFISFNHLPQLC